MRARHRARGKGKNNGKNGPSRTETSKSNQLAFNVICLALSLGGNAHTEPCESSYED